MHSRKNIALSAAGVIPLIVFTGCSSSSGHMGTGMMGYWGWGQMWTNWLILIVVLMLVVWIVSRLANRNRGKRR
jgi:uncharacterized membrane protein